MTTTAQRDRQIDAATKRRDKAQEKVTKAEADLADARKVVKVSADRIAWLKSMPVEDAPDDTGSVEVGGSGELPGGDGGMAADADDEDTPPL